MKIILLVLFLSFSYVGRTGGQSLAGPCVTWVALDNHDRSQTYDIQNTNTRAKCDRDDFKIGWYRFTGRAGAKMPDKCVPLFRCGTENPGWLRGGHPAVNQGTVRRQLCFHTVGGCCEWATHVLVRNCSRYFVYRLIPTLTCYSRYCGDGSEDASAVPTKSIPTNTGTLTGAMRQGDISASVRCGDDGIETSVNVNNNSFIDLKSTHLKNSSCVPYVIDKTRALIKTSLTGCGTQFKMSQDEKELIYYNYIHIKVKGPSSNPIIVRDHVVVFLIECRFTRSAVLSVVTLSPRKAIIFSRTDGFGNFTLQMDMFTDATYNVTYDKYPVPVINNHRMYLQAEVKTNDARLVLSLGMCKMTATSNFDDTINYKFIEEGCSKDKTLDYKYLHAAVQRLSIRALAFRNSLTVYVHCKLVVCRRSDANSKCAEGCPYGRMFRRAIDPVILQHLIVGPLELGPNQENMNDPTDNITSDSIGHFSSDLEIGLFPGFIACLVVLLVAPFVCLFLQSTCRKHTRARFQEPAIISL